MFCKAVLKCTLAATAAGREKKCVCPHLQGSASARVCVYFLYCFFMLQWRKETCFPVFEWAKKTAWGSSRGSHLRKGRRVRSWGRPQQRQGQCPQWPGTQSWVPKQEKQSRFGDRNEGQPQSMITREVPQWRGRSEAWPGRQASGSGPARDVAEHGRTAVQLERHKCKGSA